MLRLPCCHCHFACSRCHDTIAMVMAIAPWQWRCKITMTTTIAMELTMTMSNVMSMATLQWHHGNMLTGYHCQRWRHCQVSMDIAVLPFAMLPCAMLPCAMLPMPYVYCHVTIPMLPCAMLPLPCCHCHEVIAMLPWQCCHGGMLPFGYVARM